MATPIIMGSLSYTVMQFVDTMMVSKLGKPALAAVCTSGLAVFTLTTFFLGIVGCVSTFVSQSLGRGQQENCARYTWQGIHLAVITGAAGVLVFLPLSGPLFSLMPHSAEVTALELAYGRVRILGFVFVSWQTALACFFQSVNRPGIPMYTAVLANALNIVLDYVLIFGEFGFPEWGVAGAATATVIAQAVQVLLLQAVFLGRGYHGEFGTRTSYQLDPEKVRELVRIGWPAGMSFFLDVFNWSIFTMLIVGRFGDTALASHNVAIQFLHLSFLPAIGLNQAIAPIVGRWIGRKDMVRAKGRTYTAMALAIGYMSLVGLTLALFGKPLIRACFSKEFEVVRLGHNLMILGATFQGFDAVNIVLFGALRGAGDTRWILRMTVAVGYGFFIPTALFLSMYLGWGAVGAWLGATLYVVILSGLVFLRFHGEGWRHVRIFTHDLPDTA